ncbi:hypothetical protein Tco_0644785 [Tanacetum coccineum]
MKVKDSLNVTFDETPPPPKISPLEDDDLVEEEAIEVNKTRPLGNDLEDKSLENNEIINIEESKIHPLENVIVEHGPLIWPTIKENGVTKTKKYEELSATEKIQADCDLKATNIILQGLPSDVYSLVNHYRVAKDNGKEFNY